MKIILRQHIFLHHLLYPSNITSCEERLSLGRTQPLCGHLTASDVPSPLSRITLLVRALRPEADSPAGGNKVSGLLGSHFLVHQ